MFNALHVTYPRFTSDTTSNFCIIIVLTNIYIHIALYWLFRVKLVRPCQLQRIICSICAVIWYREPGGEPAQAAYLSLRAREARTHTANLYCNLWRGSLDGRTDDPGARAARVCVRTGPPRRRRAHNQSTSDLTVTLHFGQDPFRPENTRQFCVLSLMQSCSLQKGTRDSPKPCCKMLI